MKSLTEIWNSLPVDHIIAILLVIASVIFVAKELLFGGRNFDIMTRQQKVAEFLDEMHKYKRPHWCSESVCACMGCVNKTGGAAAWKEKFPDEPPITKEEVDKYLENYPLPDNIVVSIGTYKSTQE